MRLVMLGTGSFAVPTLEALVAAGHEVAQVVTRPPRGRAPQASPMQRSAEALGLAVWSPESVNRPEATERLASLEADLLVVCDYGEILRPDTLATTRLGGINLHGSLLPKYRGAAPVQWAIWNGEQETGNSVIQMTPGLDAGPCLGQQRLAIDPNEDAGALEARLAAAGAGLVVEVVEQLASGTARAIAQDAAAASKAPRLKKEQGAIDWSRPAHQINNQVRALRPWPRAYTFWYRPDGPPLRLSIDRVAVVDEVAPASVAHAAAVEGPITPGPVTPGTVAAAEQGLVVAAGEGSRLEIIELQPAGKRPMRASEFLRGNRLAVGDHFGPELA